VRYIRNERNLGVPENLNRALSLARGEFLILLEDHDLIEPTYLEETLRLMRRYPTAGFAATGCETIDDYGRVHERFANELPEFLHGKELLHRLLTRVDCPFSVTTVMRRSALAGLEPFFDAKYWWYADQYLWLRLAARSDFAYAGAPLLKFRQRESDHYLADRFWETYLCIDRIHRDNWHLLHRGPSVAALWDSLRHEFAKFRAAAGMRPEEFFGAILGLTLTTILLRNS